MSINPASFIQQENVRLKTENQELIEELHGLREFVKILAELKSVSETVTTDSELVPFLRKVLTNAMKLVDAPDGSLLLLDDEKNELEFLLVHGTIENDLVGHRIPADEGIAGWVVIKRQPTLVRDVNRDPRFSHLVDEAFKFTTRSIAAAPIIGDGKLYGLIEALNQPGDKPFSETDLSLLGLVCWIAGEALANIELRNPENTKGSKDKE